MNVWGGNSISLIFSPSLNTPTFLSLHYCTLQKKTNSTHATELVTGQLNWFWLLYCLNKKYPPYAHVFEHLLSSWWRCLGRLWEFRRQSLVARSMFIGAGLRFHSLDPFPALLCSLVTTQLCDCPDGLLRAVPLILTMTGHVPSGKVSQ